MRRFFTLVLGALAMVAVALISAFIAMRLAIHGREAVVPSLTGLTVQEAMERAGSKGLHLDLENRFYSTEVAAGRVLAQDPPAGERVRREWPVRITESLGRQRVNIPDLTGESERAAAVNIHDVAGAGYGGLPGGAGRCGGGTDADSAGELGWGGWATGKPAGERCGERTAAGVCDAFAAGADLCGRQ